MVKPPATKSAAKPATTKNQAKAANNANVVVKTGDHWRPDAPWKCNALKDKTLKRYEVHASDADQDSHMMQFVEANSDTLGTPLQYAAARNTSEANVKVIRGIFCQGRGPKGKPLLPIIHRIRIIAFVPNQAQVNDEKVQAGTEPGRYLVRTCHPATGYMNVTGEGTIPYSSKVGAFIDTALVFVNDK